MKPEVYAKAMHLLQLDGKSADDVVAGTVKSLKARGAMGLLPKILSVYEKLVQNASAKVSVLTVARESDKDTAMKEVGASSDVELKIDKNIIGGYRFEGNGKLIDNSFKNKLLEVYRRATAG